MIARQLGKQREIGRRFEPDRRHAHQPRDRQRCRARRVEQRGQRFDLAAALLRLGADIDLKEACGAAPRAVHRAGQRGDERGAIDRMDRVEQRDRLFGLVRLKLADKVKRDSVGGLAQRRPFARGFLNAVFAEHALSRGDQRRDGGGVVGLGDRDQRHPVGGATGDTGGTRDMRADIGKAERGVVTGHEPRYRRGDATPPPHPAPVADDR